MALVPELVEGQRQSGGVSRASETLKITSYLYLNALMVFRLAACRAGNLGYFCQNEYLYFANVSQSFDNRSTIE